MNLRYTDLSVCAMTVQWQKEMNAILTTEVTFPKVTAWNEPETRWSTHSLDSGRMGELLIFIIYEEGFEMIGTFSSAGNDSRKSARGWL